MPFFDDSHVTDIGLEGSAGPPVGFGEMIAQSFRQQFRVDSARALDDELRNRWLKSLRMAQITDAEATDPFDPYAYRAFAQHVKGEPIDVTDPNRPLFGEYDPTKRIRGMIDANEKIKALNNPDIKTFEQILEEVAQMQRGVEEETHSMYERTGTGGFVASLIGAIGGSFTTRDPLNLITAPIGAGRTVATRIATDMGLAAAVVGYTETMEVAPAREIVGLPERNPLYNIAAATIGAGVIRGGIIEPIGYGLRRRAARGAVDEDIDFNLRDAQLEQALEANGGPTARAGIKALDDIQFIERNNPYGEGRAAQERFIAELQQVQRAMNGEPMTAVARALPPVPYEYVKKLGDYELVRDQAPLVHARMEAAIQRVNDLQARISEAEAGGARLYHGSTRDDLTIEGIEVVRTLGISKQAKKNQYGGFYTTRTPEEAKNYASMAEGKPTVYEIDLKSSAKIAEHTGDITRLSPKLIKEYRDQGVDMLIGKDVRGQVEHVIINPQAIRRLAPEGTARVELPELRQIQREANKEYSAAYDAVEAEAARINARQAAIEAAEQREAASIFLPTVEGRLFLGPRLQHDYIRELAERINAFNDKLDEKAVASFLRQVEGEGEEVIAREAWRTEDGNIDIGLREPVDPNFRFETDEGEMTVAAAMRDLQDDADLDDAMRICIT